MRRLISPSVTGGTVSAIASKSVAHRLLICAAFAKGESRIRCEEINEDISATVRCLTALGARITREAPFYRVVPVSELPSDPLLDCGESGSTLRFLVPVVFALGIGASFQMAGRLPHRPLSPLREELERHGASLSPCGSNPLCLRGAMKETNFSMVGNVSSQFISGLLFALALSGSVGSVTIEGPLESSPYLDLTVDALGQFGVVVHRREDRFEILEPPTLISPGNLSVEGDWSGAAFPLSLGALGQKPVTVTHLSSLSHQGDRAILSLLRRFGAQVCEEVDSVTVYPSPLRGISIDASQIPDLVPILATVASVAEGRTVIHHASRLRLKESDRLRAVATALNGLGASIRETEDGLIIDGVPSLTGGEADAFGDHRIAMSVAVASVRCKNPVLLTGAEVTAKSYPSFWQDVLALGMSCPQA